MENNSFLGNILGALVVIGIIVVIISLVLREVACWYWKINESVGLLHEIRDLLARNQPISSPQGQELVGMKRCPDCNENNSPDTRFCTRCGRSLSDPQTSPPDVVNM